MTEVETTQLESGPFKDKMSFLNGLSYLKKHAFGTLSHPDMETTNFLYLCENGDLAFYDNQKREIEIITDNSEFFTTNGWETKWFYAPGTELLELSGGTELWGQLRAGKLLEDIKQAI